MTITAKRGEEFLTEKKYENAKKQMQTLPSLILEKERIRRCKKDNDL